MKKLKLNKKKIAQLDNSKLKKLHGGAMNNIENSKPSRMTCYCCYSNFSLPTVKTK